MGNSRDQAIPMGAGGRTHSRTESPRSMQAWPCKSIPKTMVAVAQLVESRIVIPVVVGSSPISHPISDDFHWLCGNGGIGRRTRFRFWRRRCKGSSPFSRTICYALKSFYAGLLQIKTYFVLRNMFHNICLINQNV